MGGGGGQVRQVGRDYGLGRTRFVRGESAHLPDEDNGMPRGHHLQPVGTTLTRREIGQSVESVEDMIARCLAGESAPQVVESVLYGRK